MYYSGFSSGTAEGVRFRFRGAVYQNNSLVTLEDIGEDRDAALLCLTDQTACCSHFYTGEIGSALGNWFFPNGTRIPSTYANYTTRTQWDFHRTRGQMIVHMRRRRGGVDGIYRCEIPDAMNVTQTIYIGVYSANTGVWYIHVIGFHSCNRCLLYHTSNCLGPSPIHSDD